MICYSDKGRTRYNPIMIYTVVTYVNMRMVKVVDRIVELCEKESNIYLVGEGTEIKEGCFL